MKKLFFTIIIAFFCIVVNAQNLGIGTSSPGEKVHILGNDKTNLRVHTTNATSAGLQLIRSTSAASSYGYGVDGQMDYKIENTGELNFSNSKDNDEISIMTLTPDGEVIVRNDLLVNKGGRFLERLMLGSGGSFAGDGNLHIKASTPVLTAETTTNNEGFQLRVLGQNQADGTIFRLIDGFSISSSRLNIRKNGIMDVASTRPRMNFQDESGSNGLIMSISGLGDAAPTTKMFRVLDGSAERFIIRKSGEVNVIGSLSKGSGSFKIDHPLDPKNKYLYHSFVESPDMMNVYNGNIVTDAMGMAEVVLPDYFMALNRDFRYQLTSIGTFAQAIIKEKISNNRFIIQTDQPGVEVSWQITGIRHDPFANSNRIIEEVEKEPGDKGRYLHAEAYGAPVEQQIGFTKEEVERNE